MRYIVKARLKQDRGQYLKKAVDDGSLGRGSIAGGEYIRNMKSARLLEGGIAIWVEICFCRPPLAEEKPYWEEYFELLSIKDATERTVCSHLTRQQSYACIECACSENLENEIGMMGKSFYESLK